MSRNEHNPWWRGAAIYQIYPRSFFDANGDGIGDLEGVEAKLPYLADLGVDGVWLSPFFTSPMADFGYDIADYRDVDPIFGSLGDFDRLLATAHDLGLRVLIDQVYSHSSDQHPWFEESRSSRDNPYADWYVWADPRPDGTPPNNWLSVFGGPAWTWDSRRRQYYLHNFLKEQPDLNFHNPSVREAMLDVARFWLDRGVDGFRLDVANYYFHDRELRDNPPTGTGGHPRPAQYQEHRYDRSRPETLAFMATLRELLDSYEDRMSVAEIDSTRPVERSIDYTDGDDRLHTAYSFSLLRAPGLSAGLVRASLQPWNGTGAWPSWSISNHDVHRAVTRWSRGGDRAALAKELVALLGCLRGTVFYYQGDELGLPQAELSFEDLRDPEARAFWPQDLGRDGARTPMPWRQDAPHAGFTTGAPWMKVDAVHRSLAVDAQQADDASVLAFTRRFLRFRRERPSLTAGDCAFLDTAEPLLAFERREAGEATLCLFNLSNGEVALPAGLPAGARPVLGHGAGEGTLPETLPPYGFLLAEG